MIKLLTLDTSDICILCHRIPWNVRAWRSYSVHQLAPLH